MGVEDDFEIVDGLSEQREAHGVGISDVGRIRRTPETEAAGYAALEGVVLGETMPSTGAIDDQELIGQPEDDFAVYVDFDERGGAWFAADLVEFVRRPSSDEFGVEDVRALRDELEGLRQPPRGDS